MGPTSMELIQGKMMPRLQNTPKTVVTAKALAGTCWKVGDEVREIVRIENAELSQYDNTTVLADVFWKKQGGNVRKTPTALTRFRTWLNKASQIEKDS